MSGPLLIYGATGYTGRLVSAWACSQGVDVVLAGRSAGPLRELARSLGVPWRVAPLGERTRLDKALEDVPVVLNLAGPFSETACPLVEACLRTKTHYLDVTGELPVFQALQRYDTEARSRGVMVLPGVGFVVAAADSLAAYIASRLPEARFLRVGVSGTDRFSRGTLKTMVSLVRERVSIRREGRVVSVPVGRMERSFDYGHGGRISTAISGAEVVAAYYTTGIPNIEVYAEAGTVRRGVYQLGAWLAEPLRLAPWQTALAMQARLWPEGPSEVERSSRGRVIVAEAEDRWRRLVHVRMRTPDGYDFTRASSVALAQRVLARDARPGFQSPGRVYGADFPLRFDGVSREHVRDYVHDV